MNALSQDELKTLMGKHQGLCISIFMPTFRTGAESQQNQIRFRNLLRSAEEKLLAGGLRSQELKELLEPAQALPGNVLFWRRQSDGLALFLCAGLFRCFCLPEAFDELIVVADRFHIRPLLPVLRNDRRFYILALSQKEVRLLEGTGQNVREIELEAVPKSLDEALQYDELEKQVRFRTGSVSGGKPPTAGSACFSSPRGAGIGERLTGREAPLNCTGSRREMTRICWRSPRSKHISTEDRSSSCPRKKCRNRKTWSPCSAID